MNQMGRDFSQRANQAAEAINNRIPIVVGEMLVDGFKKSFDLQRFNDDGSLPWKEVQRRKPGSPWYGFNYKSNYPVAGGSRGSYPNGKPRRYGTRGGITNYTPTASTRSILLGWGSANLRDSIYLFYARNARVIVASDQEHAQVHNEGQDARIFGGKAFKMPKRKFMGTSQKLNREAKQLIDNIFSRIL